MSILQAPSMIYNFNIRWSIILEEKFSVETGVSQTLVNRVYRTFKEVGTFPNSLLLESLASKIKDDYCVI